MSDKEATRVVDVEQVVAEGAEFAYFSIRVAVCGQVEDSPPFKEVWRSMYIEDAEEITAMLNERPFYWLPSETIGQVYYERVVV